jgi:hypothetical protein
MQAIEDIVMRSLHGCRTASGLESVTLEADGKPTLGKKKFILYLDGKKAGIGKYKSDVVHFGVKQMDEVRAES